MDRRTYKNMANETTSSSSGGIGFVGLLTLVFITLKLTGYIEWSWLWVLSPIWISFSLVCMGLGLFAGVMLTLWLFRGRKN